MIRTNLYLLFEQATQEAEQVIENVDTNEPFWKRKLQLSDLQVSSEIRLLKHEFIEIGNAMEEAASTRSGRRSSILVLDALYLLLMKYSNNLPNKFLQNMIHCKKDSLSSMFSWLGKA